MTDVLECPGCPGAPLRIIEPDAPLAVHLRRCDSCHGIWADAEAASRARQRFHTSHYVMTPGLRRRSCRKCTALLLASAAACATCGHPAILSCTSCHRPMELVNVGGVTLDVCRSCRAVWFDRGELGLVVPGHARDLRGVATVPARRFASDSAGNAVLEGIAATPVEAVNLVVHVAPPIAETAIHGAQLAGTLAVEAGGGAIEVAGNVVEVVADIVIGIFS